MIMSPPNAAPIPKEVDDKIRESFLKLKRSERQQVVEANCTPNALEVFLHYYMRSEPHPRIQAPAVRAAIAGWEEAGMLEAVPPQLPPSEEFKHGLKITTGSFKVTERGELWIKRLLTTPFPHWRIVWEFPER